MFSICRAMAFASKMPTQMGSTRCPSLSRRITIGMFVIGSTINPLMLISICIGLHLGSRRPVLEQARVGPSPYAVRARAFDADLQGASNPVAGARQVDHHILRGP